MPPGPLTQFTGIARVWPHLVLGKTGFHAYAVFVPSGASVPGELELPRQGPLGFFPRPKPVGKSTGNAVRRCVMHRGGIHPNVSHATCLKTQNVRRERKGERNGK
jgi:hypothetical protein